MGDAISKQCLFNKVVYPGSVFYIIHGWFPSTEKEILVSMYKKVSSQYLSLIRQKVPLSNGIICNSNLEIISAIPLMA